MLQRGWLIGWLCLLSGWSLCCPQAGQAVPNDFERLIYGRSPPQMRTRGRIVRKGDLSTLPATFEEHRLEILYRGHVFKRLSLLRLIPRRPSGLSLLFLNKCGNHTLIADTRLTRPPGPNAACPDARGQPGGETALGRLDEALEQGLGIFSVAVSDLVADTPEAVAAWRLPHGRSLSPAPGALAIWAWGLRQTLDYLQNPRFNPGLQSERIGLFGHSRRGKAALLAAALDRRFAFVVPHQTGTLGAVDVQDGPVESLESILTYFPHWFTPGLQAYRGRRESLTVRQFQLLERIAPRPLLLSEGFWDVWASPWLSWQSLERARFAWPLGAPGLNSCQAWDTGCRLVPPIGQLVAWGGHQPYPGWTRVAEFLRQAFGLSDAR